MAKTYKYTEAEVIAAIKKANGVISIAAESLKCSVKTIYNYRDAFESVADALFEEREISLDFAESKLMEQIQKGNTTAIIFFLKTIGKQRGYVERQELSAPDGGTLVFKLSFD